MLRILFFLSTTLLLNCQELLAQNLIRNPSFEEHGGCNGRTENIELSDWQFVAGSGQFIGIGCPLDAPTKVYIQGMKMPPAYKGKAYAGLGLAEEGEYLQGQLLEPLEAGKSYRFGLWLRLPVLACNTPLPGLGLSFLEQGLKPQEAFATFEDSEALLLRPKEGEKIDKSYEWQYVEAEYKAKGGEGYFVLGNYGEELGQALRSFREKQCSYLYIDELSLYDMEALKALEAKKRAEAAAKAAAEAKAQD